MPQDAITKLQELLASAGDLRADLSNGDRLQLMGMTEALRNELERPDETVYRITFNEVRGPAAWPSLQTTFNVQARDLAWKTRTDNGDLC